MHLAPSSLASFSVFNPTMSFVAIKKFFPLFKIVFTALAVATLSLPPSLCTAQAAGLQCYRPPLKDVNAIRFLVVGDWGRQGTYTQKAVAFQMGMVGKKLKIDWVLSTGDNFYKNGLENIDDKNFLKSYANVYTQESLQVPWYIVLGNRDYRGSIDAQLKLTAMDARWICHRSFMLHTEFAEFFMVDTTPFVDKYFRVDPDRKYKYDWSGVYPRDVYIQNAKKELELALKSSKAKWKIVVGHHTIRSAGETGTTIELEKAILPILEEYRVDMYINGHDHCLQYIIDTTNGIHFITSGAGAKAKEDRTNLKSEHKLQFHYDKEGFVSMQITRSEAKFTFHDASGNNLREFSVQKPHHSY